MENTRGTRLREGRNSSSAGGGGGGLTSVSRLNTDSIRANRLIILMSEVQRLLKEVIGDYSRRARSLTSNPRYF